MTPEEAGLRKLPSGNDLLQYFKERADDIERIEIFDGPKVLAFEGIPLFRVEEYAMLLHLLGDRRYLIKHDDGKMLLDNGILDRLGIKREYK
jgi:hypothetical protein